MTFIVCNAGSKLVCSAKLWQWILLLRRSKFWQWRLLLCRSKFWQWRLLLCQSKLWQWILLLRQSKFWQWRLLLCQADCGSNRKSKSLVVSTSEFQIQLQWQQRQNPCYACQRQWIGSVPAFSHRLSNRHERQLYIREGC